MRKRTALETVLKKATNMNGNTFNSETVDLLFATKNLQNAKPTSAENGENKIVQQKANIFSLFDPRRPRLMLRTLNVCWIWLVRLTQLWTKSTWCSFTSKYPMAAGSKPELYLPYATIATLNPDHKPLPISNPTLSPN